MEVLEVTPAILRAREKWRYRGAERPEFAEPVGPGEESVWDFPRPPRLEAVQRPLSVRCRGALVAATDKGCRVVETAGAPTYYFPPEDILSGCVELESATSVCEWKGLAVSVSVQGLAAAGWTYVRTFPEFAELTRWVAFYPNKLDCYVDDERVYPQPGGYYGGWVTQNLRGPIKGGPNTAHW